MTNSVVLDNSTIIEPCCIGKLHCLKQLQRLDPMFLLVKIVLLENSSVKNSLIQNHTTIKNANLDEAMIGNHVKYNGEFTKISIGDYSVFRINCHTKL